MRRPISVVVADDEYDVFSAMTAAQAETEALAKGADAYVEKTRVVEDLTDTLHRLCDAA